MSSTWFTRVFVFTYFCILFLKFLLCLYAMCNGASLMCLYKPVDFDRFGSLFSSTFCPLLPSFYTVNACCIEHTYSHKKVERYTYQSNSSLGLGDVDNGHRKMQAITHAVDWALPTVFNWHERAGACCLCLSAACQLRDSSTRYYTQRSHRSKANSRNLTSAAVSMALHPTL